MLWLGPIMKTEVHFSFWYSGNLLSNWMICLTCTALLSISCASVIIIYWLVIYNKFSVHLEPKNLTCYLNIVEREFGSCWFIPCMRAINCTLYSLSCLETFTFLLIKFIKIPLMSFPTFSWRTILLNMKWETQIIEKMLLLGRPYLLDPTQGQQMLYCKLTRLWTLPHSLMRLQTLHMNLVINFNSFTAYEIIFSSISFLLSTINI